MTEDEAHKVLSASSQLDPGKFYGTTAGLGLGTGLIYRGIRCPVFDVDDRTFDTYEFTVYVLTHECDVDQANDRAFNDYLTICPVIPLGNFLEEHAATFKDEGQLRSFLTNVGRRSVNRLMYVPPGPSPLEFGALLYLNNLASTHVSEFSEAEPIATVSAFGLDAIDKSFSNHFFRPKADRLSFTPDLGTDR